MIAKPGDRIRLDQMSNDPDPIPRGEQGTVTHVRETLFGTQVSVKWDSGRGLMLIEGEDQYTIIGQAGGDTK